MATHGVRGDVIVKALVVNPRPPTTAATGPQLTSGSHKRAADQ